MEDSALQLNLWTAGICFLPSRISEDIFVCFLVVIWHISRWTTRGIIKSDMGASSFLQDMLNRENMF